MEALLTVAAFSAGAFIVFKSLTHVLGDPNDVKPPRNHQGWGNDKMTFLLGLHSENRLQTVQTTEVNKNLHVANIGSAFYEVNPTEMMVPANATVTKISRHTAL